MTKMIRSGMVLAVAISVASAVCFAQSGGEATYKAKCQSCHGTSGTPSPGMAKMMGIKPASDPAIKALTPGPDGCRRQERQGQDASHRRSDRRADQGRGGLLSRPEVGLTIEV